MMKRIFCLLSCLVLLCSFGCALNKKSDIPAAKDGKAHQVILIKHTGGATASLEWFSADGKILMSCPAFIGKNGIGKDKEGDGKTPVGEFAILGGFGIQKNPGTKLKYIEATDSLWLCTEKEHYNQFVEDSKLKHLSICEHIVDYKPQYNYGIFFDFNKEGVFGKGSGIFIQCKGDTPYTLGSIAIDEANMKKLLQGVEPTARIIIQK